MSGTSAGIGYGSQGGDDEALGGTSGGGYAPAAGGQPAGSPIASSSGEPLPQSAPTPGVSAGPMDMIAEQPQPPPTPQMGIGATPSSGKTSDEYAKMALGVLGKGANKSADMVEKGMENETNTALNAGTALTNEGDAKQQILDNFTNVEVPKIMDRMANIDAQFQQNVAAAQTRTETQMKKVLGAAQAAQDFQFHDYWAEKSTGGIVLGIIAQALGGAANGLAGNPGAPTAMDRIIERDMELQKTKFSKLQANVAEQKGVYSMFREQLMDDISVNTAFRTALNQKLTQQIDIMAQQMGVPKMAAETAKAQLFASTARSQAEGAKALANVYTNEAHAKSGVYMELAREKAALAAAVAKAQTAAGKVNEGAMQKHADVVTAQDALQKAIQNPHMSPSEQRALAEYVAQAMQNSPKRGPRQDEREVQGAQISGTGLPHFKSWNLNEIWTAIAGADTQKLREMAADLAKKDRLRTRNPSMVMDADSAPGPTAPSEE